MLKYISLVFAAMFWPVSIASYTFRHPGVRLYHGTPGVRLGPPAAGEPSSKLSFGINRAVIKQHADHIAELDLFASESRRITKNLFPDKGEAGLSPLERLYRVALFSIKELPPAEDLRCALDWLDWWKTVRDPLFYDLRSEPDRFYAYAVERRLGFIEETEEITQFEANFDKQYLDFSRGDSYTVSTLTVSLDTSSTKSPTNASYTASTLTIFLDESTSSPASLTKASYPVSTLTIALDGSSASTTSPTNV